MMKRIIVNPYIKGNSLGNVANSEAKEMAYEFGLSAQLESCEKEHQKVVREIFEYFYGIAPHLLELDKPLDPYREMICGVKIKQKSWQEFKSKYLGVK